jgi:hypothetical protein
MKATIWIVSLLNYDTYFAVCNVHICIVSGCQRVEWLFTTSMRLVTQEPNFLVICMVNWFNRQPRCNDHRVYAHTGVFQPALDRMLISVNQSFHPELVPLDLIRPECIPVHTLWASADSGISVHNSRENPFTKFLSLLIPILYGLKMASYENEMLCFWSKTPESLFWILMAIFSRIHGTLALQDLFVLFAENVHRKNSLSETGYCTVSMIWLEC